MTTAGFPKGFLWGTATSSHQVEGDNHHNDWWDWEQRPGKIRDGQRSGAAAEWWSGRAEDDLRRAAESGHNAHRFSLEWSRIEPERGRYDDAALERYQAILSEARRLGLQTIVTLNHFTLPRWAAVAGGWLDRTLVERFGALAARCGERLGTWVDLWATLNEPNVLAYMAYAGTRWPPGLGRIDAGLTAMAHQLRAHAAGYHALRHADPSSRVGLVLSMPFFDPCRSMATDRVSATAQDWVFSGLWLTALRRGVLLPPLRPARVSKLAGAFDWLGINYYGRFAVHFDATIPAEGFGRHVQPSSTRTAWTDWGQDFPEGLTRQLVRLGRYGVPIYVTENGIYDNDDRRRPGFIIDHIRALYRALQRGVDVRGYFHWSLVDNFEWAEGWSTHFGLWSLDRDTQLRKPRPSAEVYAKVCRSNGQSCL